MNPVTDIRKRAEEAMARAAALGDSEWVRETEQDGESASSDGGYAGDWYEGKTIITKPCEDRPDGEFVADCDSAPIAEFIAHARADVPALAAPLLRLTGEEIEQEIVRIIGGEGYKQAAAHCAARGIMALIREVADAE